MTPVQELFSYLANTAEKLAEVKKNEFELWKTWKESGHKPEHFRPLLKSFRPILNRATKQYSRTSAVPTEAVGAEVEENFMNACKTYNPNSGAQLGTWVHTHLRKTRRYVDTYSNIGKIPEPRLGLITKYKTAKSELYDTLDRPPTHEEVAEHMYNMDPSKGRIPIKELSNLETELSRKDLSESGFEEGPAVFESPKELEAIRMLHHSRKLNDEERTVFNHVFGVHKDQDGETHIFHPEHMKKPGEIAKITGFTNSKISRIRNSIAEKVRNTVDVL